MADTPSRLLALLALLQRHRFWRGPELADELGVSLRTIRRDIERLRDAGYEVSATPGAAGGYQLEAGTDVPPLILEDDEAIAIAVGLRSTAARALSGSEQTALRALAKLEQVLPERLRHRVDALQRATVVAPFADEAHTDPQLLVRLAIACRDHERLRFGYLDAVGTASERYVEPATLMARGRRWYLVCWDLARHDWRTFRVDRIAELARTFQRFTPRAISEQQIAELVQIASYSIQTRLTAWVVFEVDEAELRAALGPWAEGVESLGPNRCRWPIGGDTVETLAAGLLWARWDYTIEGPPELLAYLSGFRERLGRALAAAR